MRYSTLKGVSPAHAIFHIPGHRVRLEWLRRYNNYKRTITSSSQVILPLRLVELDSMWYVTSVGQVRPKLSVNSFHICT